MPIAVEAGSASSSVWEGGLGLVGWSGKRRELMGDAAGRSERTFLNSCFLGFVLDELLELALVGFGHVFDIAEVEGVGVATWETDGGHYGR